MAVLLYSGESVKCLHIQIPTEVVPRQSIGQVCFPVWLHYKVQTCKHQVGSITLVPYVRTIDQDRSSNINAA